MLFIRNLRQCRSRPTTKCYTLTDIAISIVRLSKSQSFISPYNGNPICRSQSANKVSGDRARAVGRVGPATVSQDRLQSRNSRRSDLPAEGYRAAVKIFARTPRLA